MNILITGGTGFIGSNLTVKLLREGHMLKIITREPEKYRSSEARNQQFISWNKDLEPEMDWAEAVINLAGENIFGQRWTKKVKDKIYNSRIEGTRQLVKAANKAQSSPEVFISASAAGFYGDGGNDKLNEKSSPGEDFLAQVCQDWEQEAKRVSDSIRLVIPRLGIALEKGGGALEQMILPFKMFVGGPVGSGKQYVPWIHMIDICRGLQFMLNNHEVKGIYNLNAPNPVRMRQLANEIAVQLNRPSWLRVPEMVLKLALGEAAQPILSSLNVSSDKIQEAGFSFEYEHMELAVADIINQ